MNHLTKLAAALLVLIAVLLGAYAVFLATRPAPSVTVQAPAARGPLVAVSVVVAAKALPAGSVIDGSGLKIIDLPIDLDGAYHEASPLVGRVVKYDIGADTPITDAFLAQGLALMLNDGERAVAVAVDEVVGVGNRVASGDYVDVFFTLKEGQDAGRAQARLLLSRVRVLAYGMDSVDGGLQAAGAAPATVLPITPTTSADNARNAARQAARSAVLAVPTEQVNRLLLAAQNGRLQLALRSPTDAGVPDAALFAELPPMLAGRPDLDPAARARLKLADNTAYAGLGLAGLRGSEKPVPTPSSQAARPAAPPRAAPGGRLEIVRGTQHEVVEY